MSEVERTAKVSEWMDGRKSADMVLLFKALAYLPASANELTVADIRRILSDKLLLTEVSQNQQDFQALEACMGLDSNGRKIRADGE